MALKRSKYLYTGTNKNTKKVRNLLNLLYTSTL